MREKRLLSPLIQSSMTPKFIYFDLGKVLVDFSFKRMFRQMGEAAGIEPQQVQAVLAAGLQADYEIGRLDSRAAHEVFCRQTGTRPGFEAFLLAFNDIFTPIDSMLPVVAQLYHAGYRLGILSNTCDGHWNYCLRRYTMLRAIFCQAAELAGCRPEEIFYTDDMPGHVAAAKSVGLDAVVYLSTAELVAELRKRGVEFNY
jgi:FMN phosphatase YigB (HAD superfamily)